MEEPRQICSLRHAPVDGLAEAGRKPLEPRGHIGWPCERRLGAKFSRLFLYLTAKAEQMLVSLHVRLIGEVHSLGIVHETIRTREIGHDEPQLSRVTLGWFDVDRPRVLRIQNQPLRSRNAASQDVLGGGLTMAERRSQNQAIDLITGVEIGAYQTRWARRTHLARFAAEDDAQRSVVGQLRTERGRGPELRKRVVRHLVVRLKIDSSHIPVEDLASARGP